jgi:hypothetical protein
MLNAKLEEYEIKIQNYEYQYEQELSAFNSEIFNTNSSFRMSQFDMLMHLVKTYVYHYTNILLRQIRYKESCRRVKLSRPYNRRQSPPTKKNIDVYPQIIVDVAKVSLNPIQLDYLSRTGKFELLLNSCHCHYIRFHSEPNYIRSNQSYLYSDARPHIRIKQEHKNIMNIVTPYLVRIHYMPSQSTIIKQFSQQLEIYLTQRYMAPLFYLNVYCARKELKLIKSIQFRIKKEKYILRMTDKSGIFHLGHAADYEQKAEAYRQKTGAYIELTSDPLWIVFDKVLHLLHDLRSKEQIRVWQLDKMMPKRDKVALAYLYFIPKPHKVNLRLLVF